MTGSDHTSSSPEPHSSLPAPAASDPFRLLLSHAPDLGVTAEGDSSTKTALHEERDTLGPPAIRDNIKMTLDVPPQSQSPSSVNNITCTGPSGRSLREHVGDHPPHPSHGPYGTV
jgi:hypothetical protein